MQALQFVMSFVSYLVPFVVVLSIVVFFHELGHFLVGRWCGVKVEAFSIGFGKELFAFTDKRGTRWRFALIPLGGYVKFYGDADASSMTDEEQALVMSPEERRISLFGQSLAKRAAIVAAGPIANFILAVVIFSGVMFFYGRGELVARIAEIKPGAPAAVAGFKPDDLVLSINGEKISHWGMMQRIVNASSGEPLKFTVLRGKDVVSLVATPKRTDIKTRFGVHRAGLLGISSSNRKEDWKIRTFGFGGSIVAGAGETWFVVERTAAYIGGLFVGKESMDQISGPIRIAEVSGEVAKISLVALINLAAILSISVGLLNLFPIPPLDGGHLLFFAIEGIKGSPLSQWGQEIGFRVGMAMVLALMLFATFNDILHVGPKILGMFG